jgi:hypothetical protein
MKENEMSTEENFEWAIQILLDFRIRATQTESLKVLKAVDLAISALGFAGCGCGLCLSHNDMVCPRKEESN